MGRGIINFYCYLGGGNSSLQITWLDSIQQKEELKLREEWVLPLVGIGGKEKSLCWPEAVQLTFKLNDRLL